MTFGFRFLSLILVSAALSACNSSQENALVGDLNGSSSCPPSGCANKNPQADNVILDRDLSRDVSLSETDTFVELEGSCSASTFPDNRIEVTVGGSATPFYGVNQGSSAMITKCSMGRYHLMIDACRFKTYGIYTLEVRLRPLNEKQEVVEVDGGYYNVKVSRAANANATLCP